MLWVKGFHIIAVVCWFAGLFYLPRLFVYHAMAEAEGDTRGVERFKIMERKLYLGIMTPSMLVTAILGLWMLAKGWNGYFSQAAWMHIKLVLVFLLIGYHHACGRMVVKFAENRNTRSHKFYRFFNELPVLILVAVVLLAVLKQPV
jgi:putative membrane protein